MYHEFRRILHISRISLETRRAVADPLDLRASCESDDNGNNLRVACSESGIYGVVRERERERERKREDERSECTVRENSAAAADSWETYTFIFKRVFGFFWDSLSPDCRHMEIVAGFRNVDPSKEQS